MIRKIFGLLFVLMLAAGVCFADGTEATEWNTQSVWLNENLNKYAQHHHTFSLDDPYGLGVVATVWESEDQYLALDVDGRYDYNNDLGSMFLIGRVNVWQLLKK